MLDRRPDSFVTVPEPASEAQVVFAWLFAWLGTLVAGGVFGLVMGGGPGLAMGPILACTVATPVLFSLAVLSWTCWLTRFLVPLTTIAGALTGIAATALWWEPAFTLSYPGSIGLAGILGAAGSGLFAGTYVYRHNRPRLSLGFRQPPRRYSLGELFLRFTSVTVLLALWTWAVKAYLGRPG